MYGFVWWGVCKQSRWRHSVTEPSEDSGYVLLWQRYDNNKMVAKRYYGNVMITTMSQYSDNVIYFCCWRCVYWACYRCILHLQQYSHRLNLLYIFLCLRILEFVWKIRARKIFISVLRRDNWYNLWLHTVMKRARDWLARDTTQLPNHNKGRRVFTIYQSIRRQFTCSQVYQMGRIKTCERTPTECRNCRQSGDRVSGCAPPTIFFVQAWSTVVRKSGISANCLV